MTRHELSVAAPVVMAEVVGVPFHTLGAIFYASRGSEPVGNDFHLRREIEHDVTETAAVFECGDEPLPLPIESGRDGVGR